jgi:CubicO group peptidase (beta-lactamase class C family)
MAAGKDQLAEAVALLDRAAGSGEVAAAVLHVVAPGRTLLKAFGRASADSVFLLASITKPMTAAVVMRLIERGRMGLDDPVRKHLPGCAPPGVTVRHLLTHTSGLPDMLPDNQELRRRHAPLSEFQAGACRAAPLFAPGAEVRYQSMGFLLAAAIAEKVAGTPFRELMSQTLFAPLQMTHSALGLGGHKLEETARCQVPDDAGGWNSPYWRDLGSPWGGAHGTAPDITRLLRFFARPTAGGPLKPETVRLMLTPQTPPGKKGERYGLGWRLGLGGHPHTFGHSGSTGTVSWMDPDRDLSFVLLTTLPAAESNGKVLQPVSDLVGQSG